MPEVSVHRLDPEDPRRVRRPWPIGATKPYHFRFFPEYSADSPFWSADRGLTPITALPLSSDLACELAEWNEYFETKFHWEHGWAADADPQEFYDRAVALCQQSRDELGDDYVIDFKIKSPTEPW